MNEKTSDFDSFLRNVLAQIPEMRPLSEIRTRYRAQIEEACARHLANVSPRDAVASAGADLIVRVKDIWEKGVQSVCEWADSVFERELVPGACYTAFATRGIGGAPKPAHGQANLRAFVKQGGAFPIRLELNTAAQSGLDIAIYPADHSGSPLIPFWLTAIDLEDGRKIIDRQENSSGPAVIYGVDPGCYRFLVETESATGTFDFKVD